jgi:group I intron endonuclease
MTTEKQKEASLLIYKIINKVNGKVYIGQTVHTAVKRWQQHLVDARQGSRMAIHCAMRKHGIENFCIRVLEAGISSIEELNNKETHYIALNRAYPASLGFGYNLTSGGEGYELSQETREQISRTAKMRMTPERRAKISACVKLAISDPDVKAQTIKGITEHWANMSETDREIFREVHRRPATESRKLAVSTTMNSPEYKDYHAKYIKPKQRAWYASLSSEEKVRRGANQSKKVTGQKRSDEFKARMREIAKGRRPTPEALEKAVVANRIRLANMSPEEHEASSKKLRDSLAISLAKKRTPEYLEELRRRREEAKAAKWAKKTSNSLVSEELRVQQSEIRKSWHARLTPEQKEARVAKWRESYLGASPEEKAVRNAKMRAAVTASCAAKKEAKLGLIATVGN